MRRVSISFIFSLSKAPTMLVKSFFHAINNVPQKTLLRTFSKISLATFSAWRASLSL